MIVDVKTMKKIEEESGFSSFELMNIVGNKIKEFIELNFDLETKFLIVAGNGNNGGDALVLAKLLHELKCDVKVYLIHNKPKTKESLLVFKTIDKNIFITKSSFEKTIEDYDVIVDGIYGFSYHRPLSKDDKKTFDIINNANKKVISIDINSGCEADGDYCDDSAIKSTHTLAIQCYKPFHLLKKQHHLFDELVLLDLGINHSVKTNYTQINKEIFLKHYPKTKEDSYKGKSGRTLLIGGGWGMVGALGLNIIGAQSVGITYLNVGTDYSCYPILANRFLTSVFHTFNEEDYLKAIKPLIDKNNSIGFGSGGVNLPAKKKILDLLLQFSSNPLILDAEAINLLARNYYVLNLTKSKVVLTPHIFEFSKMINMPIEQIEENKIKIAQEFSKKHNVVLVLKGVHTIVTSSDGRTYINQTGNQILARAGSGDLLTGMISGLSAMIKDTYLASVMAVWLAGYIADVAKTKYATCNFKLENFEDLLQQFFYENNL